MKTSDRVQQLLKLPVNQAPAPAVQLAQFLCKKYGTCFEIYVAAYEAYAIVCEQTEGGTCDEGFRRFLTAIKTDAELSQSDVKAAKVNDPVTMTISKYKLEVGANRVSMPQDSRILTAAIQNGVIVLWALVVSPQDSCQDRLIMVYGTGWPIECWPGRYIATAISDTGAFVWHVFEVKS
jgi:hypothetical protein